MDTGLGYKLSLKRLRVRWSPPSITCSRATRPRRCRWGNARLFRRFQAVEGFDSEDQEAIIRLIDGMIAKHKMQTTLTSLDDQGVNA